MRTKFFFIPLAVSALASSTMTYGQGFKDLMKEIGKGVSRAVDQKITEAENPCIEKESVGLVSSIDPDRAGTWVVQTTDGRTFQLSSLSIDGLTEIGAGFSDLLSIAESAQFSLMNSTRLTKVYRVHLNYRAALGDRPGVGGILSGTLNEVYKNRMYNDFKFENAAIGGTSLTNEEWCLNIPSNTLRSISFVPDRR